MLARTTSCRFEGLETSPVTVEAEILNGFSQFTIVGLAGASIQEAKERIRAAISALGLRLPLGRIIVNLYPGDLKKGGTQWDLPMALTLLGAMQRIPIAGLAHKAFLGELSLDGNCRPVPGAYAMVSRLVDAGVKDIYLPAENVDECRTIAHVRLYPCHTLLEVINDLDGSMPLRALAGGKVRAPSQIAHTGDYAELKHAENLKRVLEIAVAGRHHLLLIGPPGMGKSMALSRLPSILPPLSLEEERDVRTLESLVTDTDRSFRQRPVRSVLSTITPAALLGGGVPIFPGEITLAHHGVLVMDELPLFPTALLNQLRLPLERQHMTLSRGGRHLVVPSDFQFMATANPCPCGYAGDPKHQCTCKAYQIHRYRAHVPSPILDRIDLIVTLADEERGSSPQTLRSSADMLGAITEAQQRAKARNGALTPNARLSDAVDGKTLCCTREAEAMLCEVTAHFALSRRAARRLLLVARTIADLDGKTDVDGEAVLEAFQYRRAMDDWAEQSHG